MIRVLHNEPIFSELFVAHLLLRNIRVEADLVDQLFNSSEKRLARVLLLLANFGKEGKPEAIIPTITQETLADMIGKRIIMIPSGNAVNLQTLDLNKALESILRR